MVSLTFILLAVLSLCFYSMLLHEHDIKKIQTAAAVANIILIIPLKQRM